MPASTEAAKVIDPEGLTALLASGRHVVLLDVRHSVGVDADEQRREYAEAHLPGAHLVILPEQLAGPKQATGGNYPLPSAEQLQETVRQWGIHEDSTVVVYGRKNLNGPTRAWLVLSWAGHPDVRYLDGGLPAWQAAGGEVEHDAPALPGGGTFTVKPGNWPVIDAEQAAEVGRGGVLIDARRADAYAGDPEKPGSGHIPGAVSYPAADSLGADGRLLPDDELRARFAELGVTSGAEVAAYCGGGVAASHVAFVLARLGIAAPVYVGSWSDWRSDPSRPVEQGEPAAAGA